MSGRVGPLKPSFINTYSLDFDGMDDYVFIENGIFDATNGLTLSFWVKYDGVGAGTNWLFSNGGTGGVNSQFNTRLASDGRWFNYLAGGSFYTGIAGLNDGNWHHLTQVIDYQNSIMHFYKDGIKSTATRTSTYSQVTWGTISTPFFPFKGQVDEVTLIGRVLTQSEITSISSKPTDLTPLNPIAWYRMGDNGSYKDPQWLIPSNENKDKVSNYSMEFDGVNDYIDCGNDSSINISGDITLSFWVNIKAQKNFNGILSKIDSSTRNYEILVRSTGQVSFYTTNSPTGFTTSTSTIPINTWTHVLVTVESGVAGGVKFYFNGVLDVTTGTQTVVAQTHNLNLGRRSTGGFNLNGKLDDVSIFPRVLTSGEISTISTEPTDLTPLNPSAWWKMGEEATFVYGANPDGTWTIPDQVGSNDGTSNNLMADSARVGTAPSSSNNAVSFNMDLIDRVENTP